MRLSSIFSAFREFFSHALFFAANAAVVLLPRTKSDPLECQQETTVRNVTVVENYTDANNSTNIFETETDVVMLLPPSSDTLVLLGWVSLGLWLLLRLSNELQKVYLLFGLVRSPLHRCYSSDSNSNGLFCTAWHHLRSLMVNFGLGLFLTLHFKAIVTEDCMIKQGTRYGNLNFSGKNITKIFFT